MSEKLMPQEEMWDYGVELAYESNIARDQLLAAEQVRQAIYDGAKTGLEVHEDTRIGLAKTILETFVVFNTYLNAAGQLLKESTGISFRKSANSEQAKAITDHSELK